MTIRDVTIAGQQSRVHIDDRHVGPDHGRSELGRSLDDIFRSGRGLAIHVGDLTVTLDHDKIGQLARLNTTAERLAALEGMLQGVPESDRAGVAAHVLGAIDQIHAEGGVRRATASDSESVSVEVRGTSAEVSVPGPSRTAPSSSLDAPRSGHGTSVRHGGTSGEGAVDTRAADAAVRQVLERGTMGPNTADGLAAHFLQDAGPDGYSAYDRFYATLPEDQRAEFPTPETVHGWGDEAQTRLSAALAEAPVEGIQAGLRRQAEARELYSEGQAAFDQGEYAEALSHFERAFEACPDPIVLVAMSSAQERLGDLAGAVESLERYADAVPTPDPARLQHLEELRARLAGAEGGTEAHSSGEAPVRESSGGSTETVPESSGSSTAPVPGSSVPPVSSGAPLAELQALADEVDLSPEARAAVQSWMMSSSREELLTALGRLGTGFSDVGDAAPELAHLFGQRSPVEEVRDTLGLTGPNADALAREIYEFFDNGRSEDLGPGEPRRTATGGGDRVRELARQVIDQLRPAGGADSTGASGTGLAGLMTAASAAHIPPEVISAVQSRVASAPSTELVLSTLRSAAARGPAYAREAAGLLGITEDQARQLLTFLQQPGVLAMAESAVRELRPA